jgi:nucleoside-diphosphate-sugar epimerase
MKVLITGSAGFIGRHLTMRLALDKDLSASIIGIDSAPMPAEFNMLRITYVIADIRDEQMLMDIFQKYKPDIVFHLAALLADKCEETPETCLGVNIMGLNNVLKASVSNNVRRVIFASSISVYSPGVPEPVKEDFAGNPLTVYGITKYSGELLGLWYSRKANLEFIGLRFSVVFGPGRTTGISVLYSSKLIEDAFKYNSIEVVTSLDAKVNYLFISDAVEALVKAATVSQLHSKIYNICGFEHNVMELIDVLYKYFPHLKVKVSPILKVTWPSKYDISRAERELGWKPLIDIKKSVDIYIKCLSLKNPYCYLDEG